MQPGWFSRLLALVIALSAWIGIGIHVEAQMAYSGSVLSAVWVLGGYFTVLTNLVVAVTFSVLTFSPNAVGARSIAGVAISIALVGVVYGLLLRGLVDLTAGAAIANVLLHMVTPALVPLFWLFCVPRGALQWRDPLLWALYPVAYLVYALIRGSAEGRFAYPFIDYVANGMAATVVTIAIITAAFLVFGWLMVALDKRLAR